MRLNGLQGVAIGLSLFALSLADYNNNPCCDLNGVPVRHACPPVCLTRPQSQPDSVITTLRVLYGILGPCVSSIALARRQFIQHDTHSRRCLHSCSHCRPNKSWSISRFLPTGERLVATVLSSLMPCAGL